MDEKTNETFDERFNELAQKIEIMSQNFANLNAQVANSLEQLEQLDTQNKGEEPAFNVDVLKSWLES